MFPALKMQSKLISYFLLKRMDKWNLLVASIFEKALNNILTSIQAHQLNRITSVCKDNLPTHVGTMGFISVKMV